MTDTTQAQHLKAAAQQALTVLRGCLEHPDAGDAISALQHAIAQPVIAPTPVHWVMLTDEEILFAWNLRGKDGILGSLRDVETALIAKQEDKPAWPKEEQPDGSINEVDPFDMLARLDAVELDSKLLDWLDRELACPLTLHDGRYLNLGDKSVRHVIKEAMKGKP